MEKKILLANFVESVNEKVDILDTFWVYGEHFSLVNLKNTGYHKKSTDCYTAVHTKTGRVTVNLENKTAEKMEIYDIKNDIAILLKANFEYHFIDGVVSFIEKTKYIPIIQENLKFAK